MYTNIGKNIAFISLLATSSFAIAESLELKSTEIAAGKFMDKEQEYQGFGCNGSNLSPELSWTGAPKETKAFAITVYDPDAPTGSGWWHWQVVNIPSTVTTLKQGAGAVDSTTLPGNSTQIGNDYGVKGFGGACPPEGHGVHRYQFTIHALSKELELPQDASGALAGYMINANSLESSTIEALYKR